MSQTLYKILHTLRRSVKNRPSEMIVPRIKSRHLRLRPTDSSFPHIIFLRHVESLKIPPTSSPGSDSKVLTSSLGSTFDRTTPFMILTLTTTSFSGSVDDPK